MEVYAVGGSVRDELLGLPVQDRDWVVVGATREEMLRLGYLPVGRDFPVFLHPQTREEYALARTERKTAPGYHGFVTETAPGVRLEDDLRRRDLTINAMARDRSGDLVDPFGGARDLRDRVLRHVSEAFVEDPVRILRVARFAARYADFSVATETMALMRGMVMAGEADHLVAERLWQEVSRGLMEGKPSRMFAVLRDCGALSRVLPEVDALFGVPQSVESHPERDTGIHVMLAVDWAARHDYPLPVRFATLMHDLGKAATPPEAWPDHRGHEALGVERVNGVCERLRVPAECRDLASITTRLHGEVNGGLQLDAPALLALIERADGLRRPGRFEQFLAACACDFHGRPGYEDRPFPQGVRLSRALAAARGLNAGAIARGVPEKTRVPDAIRAARVAAIQHSV